MTWKGGECEVQDYRELRILAEKEKVEEELQKLDKDCSRLDGRMKALEALIEIRAKYEETSAESAEIAIWLSVTLELLPPMATLQSSLRETRAAMKESYSARRLAKYAYRDVVRHYNSRRQTVKKVFALLETYPDAISGLGIQHDEVVVVAYKKKEAHIYYGGQMAPDGNGHGHCIITADGRCRFNRPVNCSATI
jgi:hypothetical protein